MARPALLISAAVVLVSALALVLVPFETRLATEARDGRRLGLTVGLQCRGPVLDGLELGSTVDDGAPTPCTDRARPRLASGLALGLGGTGLLLAGLRRPLQPSRR